MVYKLVERENAAGELEPVAKTSAGKRSLGGAKQAARRHNSLGIATAELIGTVNDPAVLENTRDLIRDFVVSGELLPGFTGEEAVRTATERHSASLAELPESARRLSEGEPVIPPNSSSHNPSRYCQERDYTHGKSAYYCRRSE